MASVSEFKTIVGELVTNPTYRVSQGRQPVQLARPKRQVEQISKWVMKVSS